MSKIRVRLLGGLEVWHEDRQVSGFESQKSRALLAYLLCHRGRSFSRDHLAGLLWPERTPEAARHALRQAVYNLRSTLPEDGCPPLLTNHLELGIHPDSGWWVDVDAFEDALRRAKERGSPDPHHLTAAVQLYRGDLLAGFFVKDSPQFEEWLVTEQERLRETVLEALWTLVDSYRRRGEHRFALHYARRLVAIEPLSEKAHRELMQLCVLTGRRGRALAQFEELENLLRTELGVEPLEETRDLYEAILTDTREEPPAAEEGEVIGPLVPLVGRREPYGFLREVWQRVQAGESHLTLVEGEAGIGKTRLIKSFLDAGTAQRRAVVLKGRGYELASPVAYQPIAEVIRGAVTEELDLPERNLAPEVLDAVARLVPELRSLHPDLLPLDPDARTGRPVDRPALFEAVARFFESWLWESEADPLILFLDDLHLADRSTLELLAFLLDRLRARPLWVVASYRPDELPASSLLREIAAAGIRAGTVTELRLDRLDGADLEEIAASLVDEKEAPELCRFLERNSGGLPLAVAELINFLWDEGVLAAHESGRWTLTTSLHSLPRQPAEDLDELILLRIRRLPNSTRRLATLAAVAGQTFEVQLLQKAGDEHMAVVELGMEILLKRWLTRQFAHTWTSSRRERDIVLWARGARRGSFEFSHKRVRRALYHDVNPLRRNAMHEQVAASLEELWEDRYPERLGHHWLVAGQWERALPALLTSAWRARQALAPDVASYYYGRAVEALGHLVSGARTDAEAESWRRERERVESLLAELEGGGSNRETPAEPRRAKPAKPRALRQA
ncbi:MAG TPA: BTAD domain-containing putative transcriptional regulator [Thermoanaerobaculia bacterium]|nr:BTAD domain-containing putative transcriptional regulator [Thermoanaerobaculia bacterium]